MKLSFEGLLGLIGMTSLQCRLQTVTSAGLQSLSGSDNEDITKSNVNVKLMIGLTAPSGIKEVTQLFAK